MEKYCEVRAAALAIYLAEERARAWAQRSSEIRVAHVRALLHAIVAPCASIAPPGVLSTLCARIDGEIELASLNRWYGAAVATIAIQDVFRTCSAAAAPGSACRDEVADG